MSSEAYRTLGYSRPVLKSIDAAKMTATAVLTFPEVDYAGDFVVPDGGTFENELRVNVDHRKYNKAFVGHGTVEMKGLTHDGKEWQVPVGTTHFNSHDRFSAQTFRLVADDIMTGVSLEFTPAPGKSYKSLGHPSVLEPRDAMLFERWIGIGWAHTMLPTNPNCRTVTASLEKAIRAVESGKLGNEMLDPILLKSLTAIVPARSATVTVPRTISDEPAPSTFFTAAKAFDFAQGIVDLCDATEQDLDKAENIEGREALRKIIKAVVGYADDANAVGERVEKRVARTSDDPAPDTDPPVDDPPKPVEKSLDGLLVTKSGYKPRRFKVVGNTLKPVESATEPVIDPNALTPEQEARAKFLTRRITEIERALSHVR